ncbi:MAG TPA: hypothetical protein VEJ39_05965, partial [Candidatus Acidoferrales bacterium]|nr:hypothetical protein [Candidatus Acidoferrales bacterium]
YEPGFEDMPRRVPDLEKLESMTGFRPATPLSAIIDRVIAHQTARSQRETLPKTEKVPARSKQAFAM